jgi:ferredoxin
MAILRLPQGDRSKAIPVSPVESVLNALLKEGVRIKHACGGKAQCGTCRVRISLERDSDGKEIGALSPMGERERERLAAVGAGRDERLACQTYVRGDAAVDLIDD